jgi:hypothetical protein
MRARRISNLTLAALLIAVSVSNVAASRARAALPHLYNFYWQEGDAPVVMWPTSKGYCFLAEMAMTQFPVQHEVGITVNGSGNWVLSGTSTLPGEHGSLFGVASCVPWPAGYSFQGPVWKEIKSQGDTAITTNNDSFCSLAGTNYDGDRRQHAPQWQAGIYPSTATSVMLRSTITNDGTYPAPARKIDAQCFKPANGPALYWGVLGNPDPNQTVKFFNGNLTPMTGDNTLCMPTTYIPVAGASGFELFETATNWQTYAPFGDNVIWGCIPYPGPVVQMSTSGSALTDPNGPTWAARGTVDSGAAITTGNGINLSFAAAPVGPTTLYQSAWTSNTANAPFKFTFGGYAAGSSHTVRLHFAEWTKTGMNQRKFTVKVNGATVIPSLDIFARAGNKNIAWTEKIVGTADGQGNVVVQFVPVTDKPVVSGIEVQ